MVISIRTFGETFTVMLNILNVFNSVWHEDLISRLHSVSDFLAGKSAAVVVGQVWSTLPSYISGHDFEPLTLFLYT